MQQTKQAVREFWDAQACGEVYAEGTDLRERLEAQASVRYGLEPFIFRFARFAEAAGRSVLEIGVGMGADHLQWARSRPALLAGIDLTPRAIRLTRSRLELEGATTSLHVADAERLPFADESFDIVYSWGVLHHSPDTAAAVAEVYRVLKPGGRAAVMIYHRDSILGRLLWLRYGMLRGVSIDETYARHLESPGTKAYSRAAAEQLFARFSRTEITVELSAGDLLTGAAGQRHDSPALRVARAVWPRRILRRIAAGKGLFMLVSALK
jgi:SAM-dependent methyltransferase